MISARSVTTARAPAWVRALGLAGLVRVADDGDAAEPAREYVGHGVADERAVLRLSPEAPDRDADARAS